MTITTHEQPVRDREAVRDSDRPVLDAAGIGYAPPALEVLGTLEALATVTGAPRMLGGSL